MDALAAAVVLMTPTVAVETVLKVISITVTLVLKLLFLSASLSMTNTISAMAISLKPLCLPMTMPTSIKFRSRPSIAFVLTMLTTPRPRTVSHNLDVVAVVTPMILK